MSNFIMASAACDSKYSSVDLYLDVFQQWNEFRNTLQMLSSRNMGNVYVMINSPNNTSATSRLTSSDIGNLVSIVGDEYILSDQTILNAPNSNFLCKYLEFGDFKPVDCLINPNNIVVDTHNNIVWVGINELTSFDNFTEFCETLNNPEEFYIRPLEMKKGFAPLSTCLNTVNDKLVIYPDAFTEHSLYVLEIWFNAINRIIVEEADYKNGVINSVALPDNTMIVSNASDKFVNDLNLKGVQVFKCDISSITNNGTKCLAAQYK